MRKYLPTLGELIDRLTIVQLKEVKISLNKLHNDSLILLDDKGSKTNLSISFLLKSDYKILFETDYQILFSK